MAISKARKIVEHFSKLTQQTAKLVNFQKESNLPIYSAQCTWISSKKVTPGCYYKVVVILSNAQTLEVLEAGLDLFVYSKGDYM